MPRLLQIDEFLEAAKRNLVVDVRSPKEFSQGHIPTAVNCPLFTDKERARVGTTYKQDGRLPAVMLGLEIVGPKMRQLAEQIRECLPQCGPPSSSSEFDPSLVLVHCWRGGMRSSSVCWLLEQTGLKTCLLEGGYKSFRRAARQAFAAERNIAVLSGMTGAGKTRMLARLKASGEQVVDLEALAQHRGSSFGAIDLPPQPTCEQFENLLFTRLRQHSESQTVWIEDESPSIGKVRVPDELWWQMRRSPAFYLDADRQTRAKFLADEYGKLSRDALIQATHRLEKKLGADGVRSVLSDLEREDLEAAACRLLTYYDKTYQHAAERRPREHVVRVDADVPVAELIQLAQRS